MYNSPEAYNSKGKVKNKQTKIEEMDEYDESNNNEGSQYNEKYSNMKSEEDYISDKNQINKFNQQEEEYDDGEGIHSQERNSINRGTLESADNFDSKMNKLAKFISEHGENEDNGEEEYNRKTLGRPRDTYQVFMDKIDNRLKRIKEVNVPFEEKKLNLVRDNYQFNEDDWKEILKYDTPDKLYQTSNKRLKESLMRGIPHNLRGDIWCFLCRARHHKESFNTDFYFKLKDMKVEKEHKDQIDKDIPRTMAQSITKEHK